MAELRDYTSLRVGGPAQKFVEVGTESQIIAAIEAHTIITGSVMTLTEALFLSLKFNMETE